MNAPLCVLTFFHSRGIHGRLGTGGIIRREGEVKRARVSSESSVFHIVTFTPVKAVVGLTQCGILGDLGAHGRFEGILTERILRPEAVLSHMKITLGRRVK